MIIEVVCTLIIPPLPGNGKPRKNQYNHQYDLISHIFFYFINLLNISLRPMRHQRFVTHVSQINIPLIFRKVSFDCNGWLHNFILSTCSGWSQMGHHIYFSIQRSYGRCRVFWLTDTRGSNPFYLLNSR